MRDIRKALATLREKVESAKPAESVRVIFPGDPEPETGHFIRVQVVDASRKVAGEDALCEMMQDDRA